MRHMVGWTHPPYAFVVVPSFPENGRATEKQRAVLLDYEHDDDLASIGDALITELGGPRPTGFNPDGTVSTWLNHLTSPLILADAFASPRTFGEVFGVVRQRGTVKTNVPGAQPFIWSYITEAEVKDLFVKYNLYSALQKAIDKRQKLGPLPDNDYSGDPIVIYYYDNDRIKRILYPRSSISTASGMALDPQNRYWWKGNGIATQQLNGDGTWGDEGFDWNKDVVGNINEIVGTILAILSAILMATGLGSAAGSAFAAAAAAILTQAYLVTAAVGTFAAEIDEKLSGGDLYDVLNVFVQGVSTILAGAGEKAVSTTIKTLASALEAIAPLTADAQNLTYLEVLSKIEKGLSAKVVISDGYSEDMSNLFGPALGSVFKGGYDAALVAPPEVIQGILSILTDPSQKVVFQTGALLGHLKGHPLVVVTHGMAPPPFSMVTPRLRGQAARADLLSYVKTVLNPRYHLS